MIPVQVVGLGMGRQDLTQSLLDIIAKAQALAGGRRLLQLFPEHPGPRLPLGGDLEAWLEAVAQAAARQGVVVLASGDPGFYGVAARLAERLGPDNLLVHPNVNAVAAAFARLKRPWQDAVTVSLHGRGADALWPSLMGPGPVAVFTDPRHTPAVIARLMLERDQDHWRMAVLEDMGSSRERSGEYALEEAAAAEFSPLNLAVLFRWRQSEPLRLGLAEEAYVHQAGLITKAEVRAAALALLELGPGQVLWDLGAGCGAVGLEAGLLMPGGLVYAVERDPERVAHIMANRGRFGAACLEVVQAELPDGLDGLPAPQRVFIGGGGGRLGLIIEAAASRLASGGVMVVSAVLLETVEQVRRSLRGLGLGCQTSLVQVSRGHALGEGVYLKAMNPVWLLKGAKQA